MREMRNMLFSDEKRKEFSGSIRTGKNKRKAILENGMSLEEAFSYAYLDVCRTLRGIKCVGDPIEVRKQCISKILTFCEGDPIEVRKQCISKILTFCENDLNDLSHVQCEKDFDFAHKKISEIIREFYSENNYDGFTVGKTQKWINMAFKYACIYDKKDAKMLSRIFNYCHVPIDRYIATPIVNELGVALPKYDGFKMPKHVAFDVSKCNYSWSKIDNYDDYLTCQKSIREVLRRNNQPQNALEWEFACWLSEKEKHI